MGLTVRGLGFRPFQSQTEGARKHGRDRLRDQRDAKPASTGRRCEAPWHEVSIRVLQRAGFRVWGLGYGSWKGFGLVFFVSFGGLESKLHCFTVLVPWMVGHSPTRRVDAGEYRPKLPGFHLEWGPK